MKLIANCFVGALLIKLFKGGRLKRIKSKAHAMKHWIVRTPNDGIWHFRLVRDILPYPLCFLLFIGQFERLQTRDHQQSH